MSKCKINYIVNKTRNYTQYLIGNKNNYFDNYQPDIDYCCEDMNKFLNEHSDITVDLKITKEKPQVEMRFVSSLGWYGDNEKETVVIRFCPFCGGKIELVEKKN